MKFPHYLTLTFIILKLCGIIEWSWWAVTSPIWILFIILLVIEVNKELSKK